MGVVFQDAIPVIMVFHYPVEDVLLYEYFLAVPWRINVLHGERTLMRDNIL